MSCGKDADLAEYELEVRRTGSDDLLMSFAVL